MAENIDLVERRIMAVVAARAGVPVESVTAHSRLWLDLGLAGDDFAEVIAELHRTGAITTLPGRLGDYCPTERDLAWAFWRWPFGREKTYRELTIRELARAASTSVASKIDGKPD